MGPTNPASTNGPTRRQVVGGLGGAVLLGSLAGPAHAAPGDPIPIPLVDHTLYLRRREDFVNLRFELQNIRITDSGRILRRPLIPLGTSRIIVWFPPQSVGEGTSPDNANPAPAAPVWAKLARQSRLAFDVTEALPFELSLDKLLDWRTWVPLLVPNAVVRPPRRGGGAGCYPARLREPTDTQTSIELPWRLQLSPTPLAAWVHRTQPVTGPSGWTELWHSRLAVRDTTVEGGIDEHDDDNRIVRAVWARYPDFSQRVAANNPGVDPDLSAALPMTAADRYDIVRLSSDSTIDGPGPCEPPIIGGPRSFPNRREPVEVDRLMLTALGGWLTSTSRWRRVDGFPEGEGGFSSSLESWTHRATAGRDHHVRLVRRGFMFPFGHRAALFSRTDRKIVEDAQGRKGAYLRRKFFIVPRQLVRDYTAAAVPHLGREFPFRSVRVLTRETPNLYPDTDPISKLVGVPVIDAFVPHVNEVGDDDPFPFLFRGTDHAGRTVDFRAPIVFVFDRPGENATKKVIEGYEASSTVVAHPGLRTAEFGNKHVVVAPGDSDPARTTVVVRSVQLTASAVAPPPKPQPEDGEALFYPSASELLVELSEVRALAGDKATPARFRYPTRYLENGPNGANNKGEVFLEVEQGKETALSFGSDRSGGVATPNIVIRGMSRTRGPVTETGENAADETFDPQSMFAVKATLLGGIALSQILAPLQGTTPNPGQAPTLVSRELGDGRVETSLQWKPAVEPSAPIFVKKPGTAMELRAKVVSGKEIEPYHEVNGRLTSFALSFFNGSFINVHFDVLTFSASSDQKPDVDCDITDVEFLNELSFVRELANVCNFGGGGGLSIVPATDRITIGLDVPLPSLTIGILGLENIKVSAGLVIPFDSSPVLLRFAFCSREDPFTLTVMFFRGSGFVALELGAHGLDMVEFGFEFGVGMSIDLGVASGSVEIMGGLYYQLANNGGGDADQTVTFSMYLRLRGELDVLGLISASLEFYLSLTYKGPDRMYGEAVLTVSIDLFIFSGEVEVTCRREFKRGPGSNQLAQGARARALDAGDGSEPIRFRESMPQPAWVTYCNAFAAL